MSRIESAEAAITGFQVVRRKPLAVVIWTVLMIAVGTGGMLLMLNSMDGLMDFALRAETAGEPTADEALAVISQFIPAIGLLTLVSLVATVILNGALKRSVLRPAESAVGYLRVGMDELRLLVVQIAYMLISWVVVAIVVGVLVVMGQSDGGAAKGLAIFVAVVAAFVGWIYLLVRLSLAPTQTFAERRINLFGSWALTRGQFWPVFFAFLIAIALFIGLAIAGSMVGQIGMLMSGDFMEMMGPLMANPGSEPDPAVLSQFFAIETWTSPGMLFSVVAGIIAQTFGTIVFGCTGPGLYEQLTRSEAAAETV